MIVVQLFTTDPECDRRYVGAGIVDRVVAIAPIVTDAVDDARRMKWNPDHLCCPDRAANRAKQDQIGYQHQTYALPAKCGVDVALHPVIRRAMPVFLHRFSFFGLDTIEFSALRDDFLDAVNLWAVWIFRGLTLGVMLAVN